MKKNKHDAQLHARVFVVYVNYQFSIFRWANNRNIWGKHVNLCIFCVNYSQHLVAGRRVFVSIGVFGANTRARKSLCVYKEEAEYFESVFL